MKKNIKLKIIIAAVSCFFYSQSLLAEDTSIGDGSTGEAVSSEDKIVQAITTWGTAIVANTSAIQQQLVNALNFGPTSSSGMIASVINDYYSIYAKGWRPNWYTVNMNLNEPNPIIKLAMMKNCKFCEKDFEVKEGLNNIISQELNYNLTESLMSKSKNDFKLATQPIEKGITNIINSEDKSVAEDASALGPLAAVSTEAPTSAAGIAAFIAAATSSAGEDEDMKQEKAPTIRDLLGPTSYNDTKPTDNDGQETGKLNELEKAKMFIRYVSAFAPPIKTISIQKVGNKAHITLPKQSDSFPYTTATKTVDNTDQLKEYMKNDPVFSKYYTKYKMQTHTSNVQRTIFLNSLLTPLQERIKKETTTTKIKLDGDGEAVVDEDGKVVEEEVTENKSLKEKEMELVLAGMDSAYYKKFASKSMAEVNLEILYGINKAIYFLNKINEGIERNNLVTSASQLKAMSEHGRYENGVLKPVMTLLDLECWKDPDNDKCKNPLAAL